VKNKKVSYHIIYFANCCNAGQSLQRCRRYRLNFCSGL